MSWTIDRKCRSLRMPCAQFCTVACRCRKWCQFNCSESDWIDCWTNCTDFGWKVYDKKDAFFKYIKFKVGICVTASVSDRNVIAVALRYDSFTFSIFFTVNIVISSMYLIYPLANGYYSTWKYGNATWEMPMKSM